MIDTLNLRRHLRDVLTRAQRETLDVDDVAAVFDSVQKLCHELEAYRGGARGRTIAEAARVAQLDHELRDLAPGERVAAIKQRTGFLRSKVYRLRSLARPSPAGKSRAE